MQPGVAARVGDAEITVSEVKQGAEDACVAFDDRNAGVFSGSKVRDNVVQSAVLRELGVQLAEEYDVSVGEFYASSQKELGELLSGLDPELVERLVRDLSGGAYFSDIVLQIGQSSLGITPEADQQGLGFAEGLRLADEWTKTHPIETAPGYADVDIADGALVTTRADSSVAVSKFAKSALMDSQAEEGDEAYAKTLPESQRCGGADVPTEAPAPLPGG